MSSFGIAFDVFALWLILLTGAANIPLLVIFLLAYGVLLGCSLPAQTTILINLFKQEKGTAVGIYNFFALPAPRSVDHRGVLGFDQRTHSGECSERGDRDKNSTTRSRKNTGMTGVKHHEYQTHTDQTRL